jgi:hypothetical protein
MATFPSSVVLPTASRPGQQRRYAGFIKPTTALTRTPPSAQSRTTRFWRMVGHLGTSEIGAGFGLSGGSYYYHGLLG